MALNKSAWALRASKGSFVAVVVALGGVISGCSKPPSCTEGSSVKQLIDAVQEKFKSGEAAAFPDDPNGLVATFLARISLTFETIVDDGYKADSKKQMCKANVVIQTINGPRDTALLSYGLQKDKEKGGVFISTDDIGPIITTLETRLQAYYVENRFTGDWVGAYTCDARNANGNDGQDPDQAHGAFTQQVTLHVSGTDAKLTRPTKAGGFESLKGIVNVAAINNGATLTLEGIGKNSPEDTWKASFEGIVKGNLYEAQGGPRVGILGEAQGCTLTLKLSSAK